MWWLLLKILEVCIGVTVFALGLAVAFGILYWLILLLMALPGLFASALRGLWKWLFYHNH